MLNADPDQGGEKNANLGQSETETLIYSGGLPIVSIWAEEKRLEAMLESEVLSVVGKFEDMAMPSSDRRLARRAFRSAWLRLGSASEQKEKHQNQPRDPFEPNPSEPNKGSIRTNQRIHHIQPKDLSEPTKRIIRIDKRSIRIKQRIHQN